MQRTSRIPKPIKGTQRTYQPYNKYTAYVKYVDNSWLHIFQIVFFGFHRNKFQELVSPQKSEWLYPGLFMTVKLQPFFTLFDALVWYCEGLIYLVVTDISMGVEWPLSLVLKGIFRYICLTNYDLLKRIIQPGIMGYGVIMWPKEFH